MLRNYRVFLKQFFQHYHTIGSVLPSSGSLAKALCRYVGNGRVACDQTQPRKILEVGPGTGAVTAKLVTLLRPGDQLTLVELNSDFVQHLRRRFENEPAFKAVAEQSNVLHTALEELPREERWDFIISGLPLNNFTVGEVEQILTVFESLLAPGGVLSFFEYIAIRRVKAVISRSQGRARLRGIGQALDRVLSPNEIKRDWVWPNVPPAWVHHVRFGE
jgi:phosphatidylethanolamine/phosphatidyl-N-methylethanolamine N-methyltransferase